MSVSVDCASTQRCLRAGTSQPEYETAHEHGAEDRCQAACEHSGSVRGWISSQGTHRIRQWSWEAVWGFHIYFPSRWKKVEQ